MRFDQIMDELLDASNLAAIFFLLACVFFIQSRGLNRELEDCSYWSSQAYSRLTPAAKQDLDAEWEIYADLMEDMAEGYR